MLSLVPVALCRTVELCVRCPQLFRRLQVSSVLEQDTGRSHFTPVILFRKNIAQIEDKTPI
jgi:hypothetical protein